MAIPRNPKKPKFKPKVKKTLYDKKSEREMLAKRVNEEAPPCQAALWLNPSLSLEFEAKIRSLKTFNQLPLSQKTIDGLTEAGFTKLLEIQRRAIPHALVGRDILGAAKTGSGKTLAFVVPLLEKLYRAGWTKDDGVGAIIISPTRELSMQIFEVLKKIGKHHNLSAGLIIGGMVRGDALSNEKKRISQLNIIVCTPGRLLQHMDETFGFHCDALGVLVLDEADRLLDLGFARELKGILANLPVERQTMLFSATQTGSVEALSRVSLVTPEVVAVKPFFIPF